MYYIRYRYHYRTCGITGTDIQFACDSLTWIDGITYTASNNTATHTLTAANGCDSIVSLDLIINYSPVFSFASDTISACNTDSVLIDAGSGITSMRGAMVPIHSKFMPHKTEFMR